jgi:hypothetical protein
MLKNSEYCVKSLQKLRSGNGLVFDDFLGPGAVVSLDVQEVKTAI